MDLTYVNDYLSVDIGLSYHEHWGDYVPGCQLLIKSSELVRNFKSFVLIEKGVYGVENFNVHIVTTTEFCTVVLYINKSWYPKYRNLIFLYLFML